MIKRKWRGYWLHKILDRTDESLVKDVCWSAYLGLLIFVNVRLLFLPPPPSTHTHTSSLPAT